MGKSSDFSFFVTVCICMNVCLSLSSLYAFLELCLLPMALDSRWSYNFLACFYLINFNHFL